MITSFFVGASIALAFSNLKTWFDVLELRSKLREAEFQLNIVSETIEKLIVDKGINEKYLIEEN